MKGFTATLIDSNILIYGFDAADRLKRDRATFVTDFINGLGSGCVSTQVMGEVYYNLTRGSKLAMPHDEASEIVHEISNAYPVHVVHPATMLEAIRLKDLHTLHFWDAVILATAKENGVYQILSEDQTNLRMIEGVRYINPFDGGFDVRQLS